MYQSLSANREKETAKKSGLNCLCGKINVDLGNEISYCVTQIYLTIGKSDIEVDTVHNIGRYVDLECLSQRAPLVSKTYDEALTVHGRERCKREHVLLDDILLHIVETKVSVGISHGNSGMCKAVKTFSSTLNVPVVEEIVVKKGASYKAVLIDIDLKCSLEEIRNEETVLCNRYAVIEN